MHGRHAKAAGTLPRVTHSRNSATHPHAFSTRGLTMNPSERTKEALLAKTEALCTSIMDQRKEDDPWGGNGYLSTILRATKMHPDPQVNENDELIEQKDSWDYATSAQKELVIKEQAAGLVRHP
jgi:hypothetical protein